MPFAFICQPVFPEKTLASLCLSAADVEKILLLNSGV